MTVGRVLTFYLPCLGFVQRNFSVTAVSKALPKKHEYVLFVRLSETQKQLYRYYLERFPKGKLFKVYNYLRK